MSDPLSRMANREEAIAARGERTATETPHDRLWTAVWALVGVVALLLAATVATVVQNDEAKEDRADLLDVACSIAPNVTPEDEVPPTCLER